MYLGSNAALLGSLEVVRATRVSHILQSMLLSTFKVLREMKYILLSI
jgi:hypothetical protein